MNELILSRLMGNINSLEPSQNELWDVVAGALSLLNPTYHESLLVRAAFIISFDGHKNAPPRESGEAYIFHPVRAAVRESWRQRALGIKDITVIVEILLHDCFEEAEKAGLSPMLMFTRVEHGLGGRDSD